MNNELQMKVEEAKKAAIEVLLHNKVGPCNGLPKTSGFEDGYYEPYTRDLMIASLGILITENKELIDSMRKVLETLAQNQTERGHIPGLVDNKEDVGASDTTPLFLLGVGLFREKTGEKNFLEGAVKKAMTWMEYRSSDDSGLVDQQQSTDWRDEGTGHGFCLFVNTILYSSLRLFGNHKRAEMIRNIINSPVFDEKKPLGVHQGLLACRFYAMCVFKPHRFYQTNSRGESPLDKWFDLLGNSIAILSGVASYETAKKIILHVESKCKEMQAKGELALDLPPHFFPFVQKTDREWLPRYELYGIPGEYLNGGIWPFVGGFYVAALVAAGEKELAEQKLDALTDLVKLIREPSTTTEQENLKSIPFGFNEWIKAQTGKPRGHNWQTWSTALYLYAAKCVETNQTPFFDKIRGE